MENVAVALFGSYNLSKYILPHLSEGRVQSTFTLLPYISPKALCTLKMPKNKNKENLYL